MLISYLDPTPRGYPRRSEVFMNGSLKVLCFLSLIHVPLFKKPINLERQKFVRKLEFSSDPFSPIISSTSPGDGYLMKL